MDDIQQGDMQNMPQGNMPQDVLEEFMHNAFWLEDRISVTFKASVPGPILTVPMIMPDLRNQVDDLNALIRKDGIEGVSLHFFYSKNTGSDSPNDSPPGVYLFGSKPAPGQ